MHMADALLSPAVAGVMTAATVGAVAFSVKKTATEQQLDEKKIPMMGIMGAFVFSAQMINFTIPGTGSSGHIGGGILLASLLGPCPALIVMAGILLIQCLIFADGGLMAYGCNVFNMGVIMCLFAWPLIYKPIVKRGLTRGRIIIGSVLSVTIGLQLGAFLVVLETTASGITKLPFATFATLMQPIHLAIGLTEGIVTAAVLCFVHRTRPEILDSAANGKQIPARISMKKILIVFSVLVVFVGGGLSLYASGNPDGLEWSIAGIMGEKELEADGGLHAAADAAVAQTAFLPDYGFSGNEETVLGTPVAGIVGGAITFALAGGVGLLIFFTRRGLKRRKSPLPAKGN